MPKRYFWLKLKNTFFDQPKIKKLRRLAGGDTYTVIYLKLQLLSIENEGLLEYEGIEETFAEELALKIDEDPENIEVVLRYLTAQGLMEEQDGDFLLVEAAECIGSETESAKRMRRLRGKIRQNLLESDEKASQCDGDVTEMCASSDKKVTTDIEIEKEIEKELEIERDSISARSRKNGSKPEADKTPVFITFPLNTGEEYPITEGSISKWEQLYPAVDIRQELRKMRGWLDSNPTKRKTRGGVARFVTGWLSREQDRGGSAPQQRPTYQPQKEENPFTRIRREMEEEQRKQESKYDDYLEVEENDSY